ncbi:MAG: hypothetical protein C4538_13275 [Nitrospiraceae bacterium]|nr:MAG: hypothetical protein C4538_13275 [Nitrospiraceae bacterium]
MTELKTTLDYARWYVSKGLSVIPLIPKGKRGAIEWKEYQTRIASDEELIRWFGNGTKNNIGIVTGAISGIAVVDFNSQDAVKFAKENNFPQTPLVKTGKGYHAYYKYKDGVRNFQKRDDLPNIDLRGDSGCVAVPPSMHPSGIQYQWVKGKGLDELPLADLPEIILVQKPEHKTPVKDLHSGASKGERNNTLARLTGSWVNDGLNFNECLENARLWNSKNHTLLENSEVEKTVKSIFEKHHRDKSKNTYKEPPRIDMTLIRLDDLFKEPEESVT